MGSVAACRTPGELGDQQSIGGLSRAESMVSFDLVYGYVCRNLTFQLGDLHPLALLVLASEAQSLGLNLIDVGRVDFVAVTVTLPDDFGPAIELANLRPLGVFLEDGRSQSQTHGTAEVGFRDLGHEDDDGIRSSLEQLRRVSLCEGE